jgi:DNA-binding transcriptional LysR family regulator
MATLKGAEIRHMAALVAIAREPSFTAAARRLGYAQSTLSRQLIELERAAGTRLLLRDRGGEDSLTDAGRLLLGHAQKIVARVAAARADLDAISRAQLSASAAASPADSERPPPHAAPGW